MRTPRRLVALVAATALGWGALTLVSAPVEAAPSAQSGKHKHQRDAPHDPATYYAGTEGLTGNALALALNAIIDGNTFLPYTAGTTDVWDALKVLDRDPNNPNGIVDAYNGDSLDAANQCGSSCALDGWNREHTWAQSRGSFNTNPGPGTDLFHMRPLRGNTNSSRGNKDFDNGGAASVPGCPNCHADGDSFEPISSFKGDLARGLFYMDVRYNGDADDGYGLDLRMWDQVGNSGSQIGKLSTLVAWSLADPPTDAERTRNNLIDGDYQHNRNPFIDHPEWVCAIFGSQVPAGICAANQAPTATPATKTIAEDSGLTTVALTGSDPDGDALTWSLSAPAAAHGTATITGSTLSYTPAANYNGTDVVGVTVSDGRGGTASTTVTITVTPVNDAPAATPQTTSTPQGTAKVITLAGTDVDGDSLTYAIATNPAHGTVNLAGNQATYTPTGGYSGPDSFTFTVNDGTVTSAPATVSINVSAAVNHAPTATPQSVSTAEDSSKVITLAGADSDGDSLTYAIGIGPAHGSVNLVGTQATYTPLANYNGPDSFTFTVNDGALTSTAATISVTVTPQNDAPTATDASVTTDEDTAKVITLAGTDIDGDTLTFVKASNPAHGTVTVTPAGQATYTPAADYNGPDTFTFTVNDGTVTSAPATVSIAVVDVNDAPTATAAATTTAEDTATVITLAGTDVDGDTLTYAIGATPTHGAVTLSGNQATYTPAANYFGPDSFTFTVNDGLVSSAAATLSITVTPVNDAPTVGDQAVSTTAGTPVEVTLTPTDPDGDQLTISAVSTPTSGSTAHSGLTVTYTPTITSGTDSFLVTVSDGNGGTDQAQVDVTITARAATLATSTPAATRGKPVTTTIVATGPAGAKPSGAVTLKNGTTTVGTALLGPTGTATVTWTPTRAGAAQLTATYAGDSLFGSSTSPVTSVPVAKSASTLGFTGKVKRGKKGKVKVAVTTVGGIAATGTITIKFKGTSLTATLKNGVAKFKLKNVPDKAKLKVKAKYAGDAQYAPGAGKSTYPLT